MPLRALPRRAVSRDGFVIPLHVRTSSVRFDRINPELVFDRVPYSALPPFHFISGGGRIALVAVAFAVTPDRDTAHPGGR